MIQVSRLSKRFGAVQALVDVTLAIGAGERVGLVGTNGSGKTTLLRALVGLLQVEGRVTVGGADVAREPEVALRSVAYMPQVAPPLDAPVAEMVRAWCTLRGKGAAEVKARAAGLGLDLEAVSQTRVRDLSGGMKQKLLGALALAADAPVLVCDEPTANLDVQAREAFFGAVNARPREAVLVLCSHRVDEVRHLVDRVVELREGRLLRDEPVSALLAGLRGYRVEVKLREPVDADAEETTLLARGLRRLGATHFAGTFSQAEKLEVVSSLMRTLGGRLEDLTVNDAESLHEEGRHLRSVS